MSFTCFVLNSYRLELVPELNLNSYLLDRVLNVSVGAGKFFTQVRPINEGVLRTNASYTGEEVAN